MPEGVAALLPAAGRGERLGRGPKAFVRLGARTLLEHAVDAVASGVDEIVVAVPDSHVERARDLVPTARVVAGGATRQETVARLLDAVDAEFVAVHDAARPFLSRAVLAAAIAAARAHGAATVVRRVVDSLIEAEGGATVDRSRLRAVQTPQTFRRSILLEAHEAARAAGVAATDDAALVRRLGRPVALVEGSPLLFKITTPGDLALAEAVVAAGVDRWTEPDRPDVADAATPE